MAYLSRILYMLLDSKQSFLNLIQYDGHEADYWEILQDWNMLGTT
jgi:hypothetical protein